MPNVIVYDPKGNKVVLQAVGHGLYARLDADGNPTDNLVNLATAIQCNSLFTEEQHEKFLARRKQAKK